MSNKMVLKEFAVSYDTFQSRLKFIQGKVLTIIEASLDDERKLRAAKSMVNSAISEQLADMFNLTHPEAAYMSEASMEEVDVAATLAEQEGTMEEAEVEFKRDNSVIV